MSLADLACEILPLWLVLGHEEVVKSFIRTTEFVYSGLHLMENDLFL